MTTSEPIRVQRLADPGEEGVPLMVLAYMNSGSYRVAGRAMSVLVWWGIAEAWAGHPLGEGEGITAAIREYTDWSKNSERTTWRDLDAFRRCFPGEETPARLAGLVRERREAVREAKRRASAADVSAVGQLRVVA